ncbi:hypothetical protein J3Q64DRAFT_1726732 [Phycomyces blakesleeanus]|uniref:DOP1 N-terminal domain-containing protein n=1 Tax=Phycomyces blakesleeanus TaxID=4837 RepID=A0ABR3B8H1_PHYBL
MSLRTVNDRPESDNSSTLPSPSSGFASPVTDQQGKINYLVDSASFLFYNITHYSLCLEYVYLLKAYQSDPRFRKYVQLIEKNLQSFDAVNEWADIISFLGRLLKMIKVTYIFVV